jgi:hypothetical protein
MAVHNPPCHTNTEHIAVSAIRHEMEAPQAFLARFDEDREAERRMMAYGPRPTVRNIETAAVVTSVPDR